MRGCQDRRVAQRGDARSRKRVVGLFFSFFFLFFSDDSGFRIACAAVQTALLRIRYIRHRVAHGCSDRVRRRSGGAAQIFCIRVLIVVPRSDRSGRSSCFFLPSRRRRGFSNPLRRRSDGADPNTAYPPPRRPCRGDAAVRTACAAVQAALLKCFAPDLPLLLLDLKLKGIVTVDPTFLFLKRGRRGLSNRARRRSDGIARNALRRSRRECSDQR